MVLVLTRGECTTLAYHHVSSYFDLVLALARGSTQSNAALCKRRWCFCGHRLQFDLAKHWETKSPFFRQFKQRPLPRTNIRRCLTVMSLNLSQSANLRDASQFIHFRISLSRHISCSTCFAKSSKDWIIYSISTFLYELHQVFKARQYPPLADPLHFIPPSSLMDIFPRLQRIISDMAFISFRVSCRVLLLSANSPRPSLSLFEMFGPSIKASTHALAIIWGWPNHSSSNHIALLTPPGVPSDPASAFLALPLRNWIKWDIFCTSDRFWDSTIWWKRVLNLKNSHGSLENFLTSRGGKLAPVAIRFMLATTLSRTLVLSVLKTWDVGPHSLFGWGKGGALGFNVDQKQLSDLFHSP